MEKSNIKLSIGLIVKDEQEVLEKCLLSLQPLMRCIPSELLIADTGSTDNTVKIAKKYTDNIYFYKWCNDFSKARNFVLDKSQGEWFFQIDADEYFQETQELQKFLMSPDSSKYNNAGFIIRNYFEAQENIFQDAYICRLYRKIPGRKYIGSIHEGIPLIGKTKYLDEYIYHSGYIKEVCSAKQKYSRNLPLLINEVKKFPNNIRILYLLAQEYFSENELDKAEIYYNKVLTTMPYDTNDGYVEKTYSALCRIYSMDRCYPKVVNLGTGYFKRKTLKTPVELDILNNMFYSYYQMGDYQKAVEFFEKFSQALMKYKTKLKNKEEGIQAYLSAYNDEYLEIKRYQYITALIKCKKYDKALDELQNITFESGIQILEYITPLWITVLKETQNYKVCSAYYEKCKSMGKKKEDMVCRFYMLLWRLDTEIAMKIAQQFNKSNLDTLTCTLKLLCDSAEKKELPKEAIRNVLDATPTELEYDKILFLAVKNKLSIKDFIEKCSIKRIQEFAAITYKYNSELKKIIINNGLPSGSDSIKETLFYAKLKGEILKDKYLDINLTVDIFNSYVEDMMTYIKMIFSEGVLLNNMQDSIPDEYCFIIYAAEGIKYLKENKWKEYFHIMKKAVQSDNSMNDIVKRLTDKVEQKLVQEEKDKIEFNDYADRVKSIIRNLIKAGSYKTAAEALEAYEAINPMDEEIQKLRGQISK